MTDEKYSQAGTYAKQKKSVLLFEVFIIVELDGIFIEEYSLGFFARNTMFLLILLVLTFIPLEMQLIHIYTVNIM